MSHRSYLVLSVTFGLAACGGSGDATDAGGGSGQLLVHASAHGEEGGASLSVDITRAGQNVNDATVIVTSDLGDATLTRDGDGQYRGDQGGWGAYFAVDITAGDDWVKGSIEAPDPATVTDPTPDQAFDPHLADGGVVTVAWDGDPAMDVSVKVHDFDWSGTDDGSLDVPATAFDNESTEVEIERSNQVDLVGGAAGSDLSASIGTKTTLVVSNPYNN
jgi:hypothetical protein